MKQLKVSSACSGCGLCLANCQYLTENIEGNAVAIESMAIADADLNLVQEVIANCPEHAISIVETKSTGKTGRDGLLDLVRDMEKKCDEIHLNPISNSDVRFKASSYYIPVPYSSKQYRYDYSSESQAKSVARDEFNRLCYSPAAYRPLLKRIFVEYKVHQLKPYYGIDSDEDSVYRTMNQSIESYLKRIYAEAKELINGHLNLSEDWYHFEVYLNRKDWEIEGLLNFEENSTSSGIITDLKDMGKYTSLDWYVDRMDFDYDEMYDGEGLFGRTKYKKKWYFKDFDVAAKEFIDDLKGAMGNVSEDIEKRAVMFVNAAFESYEKKAKAVMKEKIKELRNASN